MEVALAETKMSDIIPQMERRKMSDCDIYMDWFPTYKDAILMIEKTENGYSSVTSSSNSS